MHADLFKQMHYQISVCEAGVSAFSNGGNEGALYAALLVNGVQWIATVITVICVDKACFPSLLLCICRDELPSAMIMWTCKRYSSTSCHFPLSLCCTSPSSKMLCRWAGAACCCAGLYWGCWQTLLSLLYLLSLTLAGPTCQSQPRLHQLSW